MFSECYNSDGLTGYSFSHEGFWMVMDSGFWIPDGYVLKQHADNAYECADACDKEAECIAFDYRYGDNKQCVGYKSLAFKTFRRGISRAYVKCVGMSREIWLHCYILYSCKNINNINLPMPFRLPELRWN